VMSRRLVLPLPARALSLQPQHSITNYVVLTYNKRLRKTMFYCVRHALYLPLEKPNTIQ
jgi:hypothetical protein